MALEVTVWSANSSDVGFNRTSGDDSVDTPSCIAFNHGLLESWTGNSNITVKKAKTNVIIFQRNDLSNGQNLQNQEFSGRFNLKSERIPSRQNFQNQDTSNQENFQTQDFSNIWYF